MDIEATTRKKLVSILSPSFECEEEVPVWSPFWNKSFKVDVLAKPRNDFSDLVFSFEVKKKDYWKPSTYGNAFRQAMDYRYSVVTGGSWTGAIINSSFVFKDTIEIRESEEKHIFAIERFASQFGVGFLKIKHAGQPFENYVLQLGPEIWRSESGFNKPAFGQLLGKRRLGGGTVDWSQISAHIEKLSSFYK